VKKRKKKKRKKTLRILMSCFNVFQKLREAPFKL
jgi:hypothetical protein